VGRVDTGRARAEGEEMSEPKTGLASLGLDNAIRLRWVLRDIIGKRLNSARSPRMICKP